LLKINLKSNIFPTEKATAHDSDFELTVTPEIFPGKLLKGKFDIPAVIRSARTEFSDYFPPIHQVMTESQVFQVLTTDFLHGRIDVSVKEFLYREIQSWNINVGKILLDSTLEDLVPIFLRISAKICGNDDCTNLQELAINFHSQFIASGYSGPQSENQTKFPLPTSPKA